MTPRYRNALVIGKFYPPHRGHASLIRQAGEVAAGVTVLVLGASSDSFPTSERVSWLAAEYVDDPTVTVVGARCDAPVDINDDNIWRAQVGVMRASSRHARDEPVDVVVTGERYGVELAERLGVELVQIDRTVDPISATLVRDDVFVQWGGLLPAARIALTTRVVVVGAESTGTTTLVRDLAGHYRGRGGIWSDTAVVDEYGRDYTAGRLDLQRGRASTVNDLVWNHSDFDTIGVEQNRLEREALRAGSPVLLCDTDAFATAVWGRRYLGESARALPSWAEPPELPRHDLYLLTDHEDVPWEADGIREGDLEVRGAMTQWFEDALVAAGVSWFPLAGSRADRLRIAAHSIDTLVAQRLAFAPPLRGPGFEPTVL